MRQLEEHRAEIDAAGADLVVLTPDSPEVIDAAGFDLPIASVSPSVWVELSVVNADRPELPHPTTLIIDTAGDILLLQSHENYRKRVSIPDMLDAIAQGGPPTASAPAAGTDWSQGVTLSISGADDCLALTAAVAEGFHLYGARETTGRPLVVTVNEAPDFTPPISDGTEKVLPGLGSAWVLTGQTTWKWPLPDGLPRDLSGMLHYQLCTDTSCSPPAEQPWSFTRGSGPCTTPDQMD